MTTATALSPELLRSAAEAAALAATAHLPAANGGWTVEGSELPSPVASGQAVTAQIDGLGTISLVVLARLGRQLQVGPPPADDLVDGAMPAMEAAAAALARAIGSVSTLVGARELDAASAESIGSRAVGFAVHLLDGGEHAATLVLSIPHDVITASSTAESLGAGDYEQFEQTSVASASDVPVTVLHDVELGVTVELGRTKMLVRDVLGLTIGSVIELDRTAGSPVDVYVNGTLIARGEVVVVDEEFGVRISEVVGYQPDRTKR
jgi:flagellar motor switch protein FliN/FliY